MSALLQNTTEAPASVQTATAAPSPMDVWIAANGDEKPDDAQPAAEPAAEQTEPGTPEAKKAPRSKQEPKEPDAPSTEPDTVKVSERVAFRAELRERREKLAQREAELERTHQARTQEWEQKYGPAQKAIERAVAAIRAGDFDTIAAAIGELSGDSEVKDWNTLNQEAARAVQNPVYRRMRDLEKQQAERAAAEEQARKQAAEQQRAQAETQAAREWKTGLTNELSEHEDPAIADLAESSAPFIDAVFNAQREHYRQTGGKVLSSADAAAQVLSAALEQHAQMQKFLEKHANSKLLQGARTPKPEPNNNKAPRSASKTAKPIVKGTSEAAPSGLDRMSDAQKKQHYAKLMEQTDSWT